nr:immunoglobulin heavy chain junction region [Macaca mulatta]
CAKDRPTYYYDSGYDTVPSAEYFEFW